jgi:hypothetical protein
MRCPAIAAILISWPISAQAIPCEQFTARFLEGAAYSRLPVPTFELVHVSEIDPNIRYWSITAFGDVRSTMSCWHGSVGTFAVNANTKEDVATLHVSALMGIGLYAYALDWREAVERRNQLMRTAKAQEIQQAKATVEDAEASLIISFAGLASFRIFTPFEHR